MFDSSCRTRASTFAALVFGWLLRLHRSYAVMTSTVIRDFGRSFEDQIGANEQVMMMLEEIGSVNVSAYLEPQIERKRNHGIWSSHL
jgi:hypothetical protein